MSAAERERYKMVISRTIIDKLGIKLYDKASAVVAELIANAYDADAEEVVVEAPLGIYLASKAGGEVTDKGYTICVRDNGYGMTPGEVQRFYLQVGKDRREREEWGKVSREKGRPVMGRKGIGKLAPFGICKKVEVISSGGKKVEKGYHTAHLILDYGDITTDSDSDYEPEIGERDRTFSEKRGTEIILHDFAYRMIPEAETFHRQLAARFGITRSDWRILIQDTEHPKQPPSSVGDLLIPLLDGTRVEVDKRPVRLDSGLELPVKGWVAYSKQSYRDEVMAGIRIYARGKIVAQTRDFDIPSGFTGENKLRSYLVGQIWAEWLDDESGDLIRSDRQGILWNSERGQAFQKWGQALIKELAGRGETSVRARAWELFLDKSGIEERVKEQFPNRELRNQVLGVARTLVSRKDLDTIEKDQDYVDGLRRLAFAIGPHRALVNKLSEIADKDAGPLSVLVDLLDTARLAEMYTLGQVAAERVAVIRNLRNKWIRSALEDELQRTIEEAPWLINPQWTLLSANKTLERFRQSFVEWYRKKYGEDITTTTIGHARKEPDFVLLNFRNRLEVVEIKKSDHGFKDEEFERLLNYKFALSNFLKENSEFQNDFPAGVHLILVCDNLKLSNQQRDHFDLLLGNHELDHHTWIEFLEKTEKIHQDFLDVFDSSSVSGSRDD